MRQRNTMRRVGKGGRAEGGAAPGKGGAKNK